MARERRGFKGGVRATTLNGAINDSVTTIAGSDLSTWTGTTTTGAGTATISRGQSDEETITFTGVSGGNLTGVTRGAAGTTAQAHASGATLEHTSSKTDLDEANELVAAMSTNSVRVYGSATVSIADSTPSALTFNTERYDTGGLHSTVSNTGRLTAVTAGKYHIFGTVEFASNATGRRQLSIRLNGTTEIASDNRAAVNGAVSRLAIATGYALAANDYVELIVFQNSGGALDLNATGNTSFEFGMSFVAF